MKTHVMGKKVEKTYEVLDHKADDGTFFARPEITETDMQITWEEICSYDGEPQVYYESAYGEYPWTLGKRGINIAEDEFIEVKHSKFRADLGEWYQYTEKVLEETKVNLIECQRKLDTLLREYNVQKIETDSKAKAYCDLHKLDYAETDYDELLKIIDGNAKDGYEIRGMYINETPSGVYINSAPVSICEVDNMTVSLIK